MTSVIYVGLDVHKDFIRAACCNKDADTCSHSARIGPEGPDVARYLAQVAEKEGHDIEFLCGYDEGCMGYGLYRYLKGNGVQCVVLAPAATTADIQHGRQKRGTRHAETVAKILAHGDYSPLSVPTPEEEANRDYIRMRDDFQDMLQEVKRQICAFCLRHGEEFGAAGSNWTSAHLKWLRDLPLEGLSRETLNEYLLRYDWLTETIARIDGNIQEMERATHETE